MVVWLRLTRTQAECLLWLVGLVFRPVSLIAVLKLAASPVRPLNLSFMPRRLMPDIPPTSLVLDAPFVMQQGKDMGLWKPENYGRQFYGLSTLRLGIEKSRNLMTVRLAQQIGMRPVVSYARKFNIVDHMPPVLSMALGGR